MIADAAIFFFFFFGTICFYFGLVSLAYYPLALSYPLWERRLLKRAQALRYTPSVSVLVPAYNEENTIAVSLQSILDSDYPNFEVIVINDGSSDRTESELQVLLADPRLHYIRKENGGKASALNVGLEQARGEIVLFTDADSIFEPQTIRNGASYFVDPSIGAVSGNDTVLAPQGPLQKMLLITSHIGTGFVRRALSRIGVLQIISGNLGLVRTATLRRIGGFLNVWGEDLEVTLRLKRHGVRVVYGASTRVLADCPSSLSALWKQRVRWLRSYIKILRLHRDLIGNPRYGWFGPFLSLNLVNMIVIPVAQVLALFLLPIAWWQGKFHFHGLEWIAYLGLGFLLAASVVAIVLDKTPRDFLYLPYAALLLFFSHFYNAVVLYSIWAEARSKEEVWNKLERRDMRTSVAEQQKGLACLPALLATAGMALGIYYLWWVPEAHGTEDAAPPVATLAQQAGTTAVAIHFDAWKDWRDAYRNLLAYPEARYVNRVAVSAGRADWTYFRWPGNEAWWSSAQTATTADMLEETLKELRQRGYRTTAIFDVFGERYIQRHPGAAALDIDGIRSKTMLCSTELAEGPAGDHLARAVEALAATTQADTVAITELFYDKQCYDDHCLQSFRRATGRAGWPRSADGKIDYRDPSIGAWRSRQVATIAERLAKIVHAHGKKIALDVKVSQGDVMHNSVENGQDYHMLAPYVDEFVVWEYFALEGEPPERTARVAAYLDDEFGADKFFLSIGLWGRSGTISSETFARALHSSQEGGATKLWITPADKMTAAHWKALAEAVRNTNPMTDKPASPNLR
jgi:biofilm PGA synthesis N-glycosyltransferase PgaC